MLMLLMEPQGRPWQVQGPMQNLGTGLLRAGVLGCHSAQSTVVQPSYEDDSADNSY